MNGLLLIASLVTASADELTVSPAWLDVDEAPGSIVDATVSIHLNGRGMHQVRISTGDWSWTDGRSVFGPSGSSDHTAALSVDVDTVWVDATEPTRIDVRIRVPEDAAGAQYGVVFIEEIAADDDRTDGLRTTSRIAVPVLVSAGTSDVRVARIDVAVLDGTQPLAVSLALTNEGTDHARPSFRGAVRDSSGQVTTFAGGDPRFLMPGQSRALQVDGPTGLVPGRYQLLGALNVGEGEPIVIDHWFTLDDPLDAVTAL